jgi:hypothetical protein
MASVELGYTWVNLVSTGESVKGWTGRGRTHGRQRDGEVRRLAGGRFRSVGTLGVRRTQSFVIRDLTQADIDTLEEWVGQLVLVRDKRGRKMYGVYWSVDNADKYSPDYYDIAISLTEVTYEEGSS